MERAPLHIAWALLRNACTLYGCASQVGQRGAQRGASGEADAAGHAAERDIEVTSALAGSATEVGTAAPCIIVLGNPILAGASWQIVCLWDQPPGKAASWDMQALWPAPPPTLTVTGVLLLLANGGVSGWLAASRSVRGGDGACRLKHAAQGQQEVVLKRHCSLLTGAPDCVRSC